MPSITQNSELNHNLSVEPPCAAIAIRYGRIMSRIDVDAGGAGLDSVVRVTQRVAFVSVETDAGRARLDPRQSVRVEDGPASFQSGKTGKTVNCIDYRPRCRRRERILRAPGHPRRQSLTRRLLAARNVISNVMVSHQATPSAPALAQGKWHISTIAHCQCPAQPARDDLPGQCLPVFARASTASALPAFAANCRRSLRSANSRHSPASAIPSF